MFLVHRAAGLRRHAYPGSPRETPVEAQEQLEACAAAFQLDFLRALVIGNPDTEMITIGFNRKLR
jgi:hypothetical protein